MPDRISFLPGGVARGPRPGAATPGAPAGVGPNCDRPFRCVPPSSHRNSAEPTRPAPGGGAGAGPAMIGNFRGDDPPRCSQVIRACGAGIETIPVSFRRPRHDFWNDGGDTDGLGHQPPASRSNGFETRSASCRRRESGGRSRNPCFSAGWSRQPEQSSRRSASERSATARLKDPCPMSFELEPKLSCALPALAPGRTFKVQTLPRHALTLGHRPLGAAVRRLRDGGRRVPARDR